MIQDPSLILTEDVDGAPARIGQVVKIVESSEDGSIGQSFLGRTGVVVALVFDEPSTQYPRDPLIQVRVKGLGEDLFFARELEPQPASESRGFSASAGEKAGRGPPPP
jgi:hypothetical protein